MGLFSKLFQSNEKNFVSPMTGKVVAMSDIPDPAFAQKMMGDGCGIELTDGTVVAPFDAKVTAAFPTGHAFGLEAKEDGTDIIQHYFMKQHFLSYLIALLLFPLYEMQAARISRSLAQAGQIPGCMRLEMWQSLIRRHGFRRRRSASR